MTHSGSPQLNNRNNALSALNPLTGQATQLGVASSSLGVGKVLSTGSNKLSAEGAGTVASVNEIRDRIQQVNEAIDQTIAELDRSLDQVLENNEKDFLMAYRFHMLKVQNELMALKKKAGETELKAIQDAKLNELEGQLRAIQQQCMESRKECDVQERAIKTLAFEKQVMIDEEKFLDFEIRDGKEQNATLKLDLSKRLAELDEQSAGNEQARQQLH